MPLQVVYEELRQLMGGAQAELTLPKYGPAVILMAGLQGTGKTTAAGKLALFLKKKGLRVLLVATDVYRPGACAVPQGWAGCGVAWWRCVVGLLLGRLALMVELLPAPCPLAPWRGVVGLLLGLLLGRLALIVELLPAPCPLPPCPLAPCPLAPCPLAPCSCCGPAGDAGTNSGTPACPLQLLWTSW